MFSRKRLFSSASKSAVLYLLAAAAWNVVHANASEELLFRVLLDGKEIGFHSFRVADEAGKRTVEINADFDVTFFAIPVYSYDHHNREVWYNGCLEQIVSSTDDNGKEFAVKGQSSNGLFKVSTNSTQQELTSQCVMTFAYWNQDFLQQSWLLNSQTGDYLAVSIDSEGMDKLRFDNREIEASRYRLRNPDQDLDITVWYEEPSGKWLSLESKVSGGKTIRYVPAGVETGTRAAPSGTRKSQK